MLLWFRQGGLLFGFKEAYCSRTESWRRHDILPTPASVDVASPETFPMQKFAALAALAAVTLVAACKSTDKIVQTPLPADTEFTQLDTMVITAEAPPVNPEDYTLPVYRAEQDRPLDLLHTKLRVRFDWAKEQVIGQATLKLTPTFRTQRLVTLDAKNFEFKSIRLGGPTGQELKYNYEGGEVTIQLPREYQRGQEFEVYIDYVATPRAFGGSDAITSDKGLFFINADGSDPDKPQQIWTQGETEHNSNWMPTIDQPNERSTQEFFITVQDKYKTLSNGLLISSTPTGEGMRTDYWRMDQPHAPYLHMIAVGEFAKVDDTWEGLPLSYYVEEEYRPYAKEIFAHTPEMLSFFSELTGVRYPWQKYSQIVVRDYVSGAMENTTAVIFGEFVQKNDKELAEDNNDLIVAHEMFHHWFGDYVTTESWSNLTLNEGFANYSEYLWFEHHDGIEAAEDHRLNELNGYLRSGAGGGFHPLIWYQYESNEDMFDGHSYNKGGLVLHMLREYVGDEAFFAALKKYLTDNQYSAVEVDELRIAFEDTIGEDLNWFFDQWFIGNGHPELSVEYGYADGQATVTVEQTQDPEAFRPIFVLPTTIAVYDANGSMTEHAVTMDRRLQTFSVPAAETDLVVFDAGSAILGIVNEDRSVAAYEQVLKRTNEQRQRLLAIRALRAAAEESEYSPSKELVDAGLAAKSLRIRNNAIAMADLSDASSVAKLKTIARQDPESNVRASALGRLGELDDPTLAQLYIDALDQDASELVMTTGLQGLFKVNPTAAIERAAKLENSESEGLITGVGALYASTGDAKYLPFFERKLDAVDNRAAGEFAGAYLGLAFQNGPASLKSAIETIGNRAVDQETSLWRRFGFTSALAELRTMLSSNEAIGSQAGMAEVVAQIGQQIEAIKAAETNPQLKGVFGQM